MSGRRGSSPSPQSSCPDSRVLSPGSPTRLLHLTAQAVRGGDPGSAPKTAVDEKRRLRGGRGGPAGRHPLSASTPSE